MNMYGTLSMQKGAERENKESNISALAAFVDVEPSDVIVVVDVVRDEECSLNNVEDVFRRGVSGGRVCVEMVLVYLIEENLC